jgi:hypothetical protein
MRQEAQQRHLFEGAEGVERHGRGRVLEPAPQADAGLCPGDLGRLLPDLLGQVLQGPREVRLPGAHRRPQTDLHGTEA